MIQMSAVAKRVDLFYNKASQLQVIRRFSGIGTSDNVADTTSVAQVRDEFGNREIVVTTNVGKFTNEQNILADKRGYTQVRTKGLEDKGIGSKDNPWHAEGRLIQWSFENNKTIEAMGVSRKLCPDCAANIDFNNIINNNLRYGDDYFENNPKKKRPRRPHKNC
jgi:hypothetical protein